MHHLEIVLNLKHLLKFFIIQEQQHHDQTKSTQIIFAQHVLNVVQVMEEMGNFFGREQGPIETGYNIHC